MATGAKSFTGSNGNVALSAALAAWVVVLASSSV
jgi:hypothetical protein